MLIEPGELHEYHCVSDPCIFLCLQVSDDLYPSLRGMRPETLFPREYFPEEHYSLLKRSLLDLVRAYIEQAPQYELYCIGMAGLILHSLMTHMPVRRMTTDEITQRDRKNDRLSRLIQYVDRNFQGKILLRDFAKEEGLSMSMHSREEFFTRKESLALCERFAEA